MYNSENGGIIFVNKYIRKPNANVHVTKSTMFSHNMVSYTRRCILSWFYYKHKNINEGKCPLLITDIKPQGDTPHNYICVNDVFLIKVTSSFNNDSQTNDYVTAWSCHGPT